MIEKLFLQLSLLGAGGVLYLLVLLSVISVALMIERSWFYHKSTQGLEEFRSRIRQAASMKNWGEAKRICSERVSLYSSSARDLEVGLVEALLGVKSDAGRPPALSVLNELAHDAILRAKLEWERSLAILATIGSNAPFIGLFGTVLGIIRAFHDLSQQAEGAQTVTTGISEALVATAIGLLVAIPAVIAFNLFQRRVKSALTEAEALKSFLMGKMAE